jgi:hypothetical protein
MEADMSTRGPLSTMGLSTLFAREITGLGGTVTNVYDDGAMLLARSVLPLSAEVVRGDRVHGGVALRCVDGLAEVHPYTFREVCRNGAIMAEALGTWHVDLTDHETAEAATEAVAEAIAGCADPALFARLAGRLRDARSLRADLTLNLLPVLGRMRPDQASRLLRSIMDQYHRDHDASRYGLFNAVTAVARETADPDTRWLLEELGGNIVLAVPTLAGSRELVGV